MKLPREKRGQEVGYSKTGEPLAWTIPCIRIESHMQTVRSWKAEPERVGSFQSVILFQSKFVLAMQKDMEMERVKWGYQMLRASEFNDTLSLSLDSAQVM